MAGAIDERVEAVLQALRSHASAKIRDEMAPRYGIVTDKAMGVAMAKMQAVAKPLAPTTRSPRPCGRPAGTRPAWSPVWSTIQRR